MEKLIRVVNQLQDLSNTTKVKLPDLPQIIVVGEQSSGKSSVLESLIKQPILPRGEGLVTRCPVILQLNRTPLDCFEYHNCRPADEWVELLHIPSSEPRTQEMEELTSNLDSSTSSFAVVKFSPKKQLPANIFTNFELARDEINKEVIRIAGDNKGIVTDKEIVVKIFSPNVLDLTVVDLPGIVKNPIGDQPEDIEQQVNSLLDQYASNYRSIVLAVTSATQDIAASEAVKFSKRHDKNGDRTVAVLTKLDLVNKGTDVKGVLSGGLIKFKLGIFGVVNRSPEDNEAKKSIEEAIQDEKAFLKKAYPTIAHENGSDALGEKLQKILMKHIAECLPDMMVQIEKMVELVEAELTDLGEPVADKVKALNTLLIDLASAYRRAIKGQNNNISQSSTGAKELKDVFTTDLAYLVERITPDRAFTDKIIRNVINNAAGVEDFLLWSPEIPARELARQLLDQLEEPAIACSKKGIKHLKVLIRTCQKSVKLERYPKLLESVNNVVKDLIHGRLEHIREDVKKYLKTEAPTCYLRDNNLKADLKKLIPQYNLDHMPHRLILVKDLLGKIFVIIKKNFCDCIPQIFTEDVLLYINSKFAYELTGKLRSGENSCDPEELMKEAEGVELKRADAKQRLEGLKHVSSILSDLNDDWLSGCSDSDLPMLQQW